MNQSSSIVEADGDEAALPSAGEVVGGKYRLTRMLGQGGMGVVFEAEHLRLRQSVAIKFLRPDVLPLADAVERFEREARASCRMRSPHVVHVLDVDSDPRGRPYMVMERLRGHDLEAELKARGALPVEEAVDWILQACVALAEAHGAGIVHRDLKPSNLFLAEEAGTRVLKVLDFGISKVARDERDEARVSSMAMTVGTPLYMSPEQVRSSRDVDERADIWSLGVILYELVAGAPPFSGTTTAAIAAIVADATPALRDVRPQIPEALERVVMTALAKSPADRFPTAEALAAALMPFASEEGIAGPFSLRPSEAAFEIASSAMRRAPQGPRASDASDLLRLPTSRPSQRLRPSRRWEALRTFLGTAAIGFGLASGAALGGAGVPRDATTHATQASPASPAPPPPAERMADLDGVRQAAHEAAVTAPLAASHAPIQAIVHPKPSHGLLVRSATSAKTTSATGAALGAVGSRTPMPGSK